jgi:hypothetical protein
MSILTTETHITNITNIIIEETFTKTKIEEMAISYHKDITYLDKDIIM